MSIISSLQAEKTNKLVIPYTGKMFRSSLSKDNKALCFVINKGYVEMDDLTAMLRFVDDIEDIDVIVPVGDIEKIRLESGMIVYRQRVFFKSLKTMLSVCKLHCLFVSFPDSFHVTVNSVLNCTSELKYLERYSRRFAEPIDTWLMNCCLIQVHMLLKSMNMYSELEPRIEVILRGKRGYLDRSPFLIANYNIERHTSAIFLELDTLDERLFSEPVSDVILLTYGYTTKNVEADLEAGVFQKLSKKSMNRG